MEEVMISSDVGVKTTQQILERLRDQLKKNELADGDAVWAALRAEATRILSLPAPSVPRTVKPVVVLMVGVNGVGKTTSIGKLATRWNAEGKKVILGAGDTFRAAAVQQLEVWGKRVGAEVVKGKEGARSGRRRLRGDQEGPGDGRGCPPRRHGGSPSHEGEPDGRDQEGEAHHREGVRRRAPRDAAGHRRHHGPERPSAGHNVEALELTGIILTKLDGTAKGGVVLGVCDELKVPVKYIGLGERAEDLREFVAADFVEALFGKDDDEAEAA